MINLGFFFHLKSCDKKFEGLGMMHSMSLFHAFSVAAHWGPGGSKCEHNDPH